MEPKRVVVGMSGGVDSTVAAWLLKEQGYEVTGVFMKNWEEEGEDGVCTAEEDFSDVRRVSDQMEIPYYTVNFVKEYQERVFSYFLEEYQKGRTPNPDVLCNSEIKFKAFLDFAMKTGADYLATGHYADLRRDGDRLELVRAKDANKDQTYFLAGLHRSQLERVIFPIGGIEKGRVREIAREQGFYNAEKRDSTGVCFIGERNFKKFLMEYLPARPGDMVTEKGKVVGRHDGLMYYTLGQRKGLGIGGRSDGTGESFFVIGKDLKRNLLIVQQGEHEELYSSELTAGCINWISGEAPAFPLSCTAKFRYRQPDQGVTVYPFDCGVRVVFDQPQRAVTPGQWVVFYQGDVCLGGGPIDTTKPLKAICL